MANKFGTTLMSNMASGLGSSLGGGLGSIAGNAISGVFDLLGQGQQRKHEKEMQERQAKLNREAFDHEFATKAAYQDPAAERARLEAAGLNPALMYGGSAGGSSISASTTSQGSGSSSAGSTSLGRSIALQGNPTVSMQQELTDAQVDTQEALADKARAEADEIRSRIPDSSDIDPGSKPSFGQIEYLLQSNRYLREVYGARIDKVKAEIAEATSQTEIDKAVAELNRINGQIQNDRNVSESLARKYDEETRDIVATRKGRLNVLESEDERNQWQAARYRALNYWDNELKPSEKNKLIAEANNLDSLASLNSENAKYVKAYVILRALDTGTNAVSVVSREARGWATYFLNRTKSKKESMLDKLFEVAGDDVSYGDILELLKLFGDFAR